MNKGIFSWGRSEPQSSKVVQVVPQKRYIQLKETPVAKVGMVWEYTENGGYGYLPLHDELRTQASIGIAYREPRPVIENNPEWFAELLPIYVNKDMMEKIGTLALKSGGSLK